HELIPALWPRNEDAAERTVRAVGELKATLAEALARALEKSGKQIAENARAESERSARALEATAVSVGKELTRLGETVTATAGVAAEIQHTATRLTALDETLATHARQHLESLDRASSAVVASFDRAVLGGGAALDGAATTLAAAARDLNAGAEALAPRIAALT